MPSWWRRSIVAGALSLSLVEGAFAASASLRIGDPLPDDDRERVAELMRAERPRDAEAALAATKIVDDPVLRASGILLLRVETGCDDDLCMVVIGRVTERAIIPQLMLRAGPTILGSDAGFSLWGVNSWLFTFEGKGGTKIDVWERNGRWIADACADCFASPPPERTQPSPPSAVVTPERTFEKFKRDMGLEP